MPQKKKSNPLTKALKRTGKSAVKSLMKPAHTPVWNGKKMK